MEQSPSHRMYYVAILCPPDVDANIQQFKNWMRERFNCLAAMKSPGHVTLVTPFWLDESQEEALLQTLASFTYDSAELEITLDGFSHFNERVLFVNVAENGSLEELKNQSETHFWNSFPGAVRKDERPFHPHVTIATRDMKPYAFRKAWQHFSGKPYTASFKTNSVSLLKLSGSRWDVIKSHEWQPLQSA